MNSGINLTRNQSGFGLVEALIIIAVVAILGLAGFFVWNKSHKSSSTSSGQTSSNAGTADQTSAPDGKNKTFYVSDWSVSIKYKGDVTLMYTKGNSDGQVFVSSKELGKVDPKCSAEFGGVASVMRSKVGEVAHFSGHAADDQSLTGQQYADKYPNETGTLNGYVYTYLISDTNPCASKDAAQSTVTAIKSLVE